MAVRFSEALGEDRGKTAKRVGLLCDADGAVIEVDAVDGDDTFNDGKPVSVSDEANQALTFDVGVNAIRLGHWNT